MNKSSALLQLASFNLSFANKEIISKSSNLWYYTDEYHHVALVFVELNIVSTQIINQALILHSLVTGITMHYTLFSLDCNITIGVGIISINYPEYIQETIKKINESDNR